MANHIDALLQVPVATTDSAQSLPSLLSAIIENVAALKALNLPGHHTIHRCSQFVHKDPQASISMAQDNRLCINCLQAAHKVKSFPFTKYCRCCNVCHNRMLHFPSDKPTATVAEPAQDEVTDDTPSNEDSTLSAQSSFSKDSQPFAVMLSSAVAYVQDVCGNCQPVT
ncbi:hypothetical protein PR048_010734 [Dryococelus australis]|uniref:Uncharacterized protein n=1 Tax=Dryococelus australis TaxID=614101 RepID=A0ABQ9I4Q2_9NEOP|nr:hypothetical protein PR048_010734 [Dryococelus australis]